MPDDNATLTDQKRQMEKKLHEVLMEFERSTGLAVTSVQINRLDEGRVLPVTSDAVMTKVELIS
jgi:membrane protease subunit (stomatin/prohibitin family)